MISFQENSRVKKAYYKEKQIGELWQTLTHNQRGANKLA